MPGRSGPIQLDDFPLPLGPARNRFGQPTDPSQGLIFGWRISSYFGSRVDPLSGRPGSQHGGMDIVAPRQTPMKAVTTGRMSQGWDGSGGGNWSTLSILWAPARVGYGHADHYQPGANGRIMYPGEVLAYVDSTGGSTGDHLHFAIDLEDANTGWDDPNDVLFEVAFRLGGQSGPIIINPSRPAGELDIMSQEFDVLKGQLDKIESAVRPSGMGIQEVIAEYDNDTRLIVLNGVKAIVSNAFDGHDLAKFDSRDFAFCYEGAPAVYMWIDAPDGRKRQWIGVMDEENPDEVDGERSQKLFASLVRTKLNPAIVVFEPDMLEIHRDFAPLIGVEPPESAMVPVTA